MPFAEAVSTPRIVRANRRAFPRVRANDLPWLAHARLSQGPAVSLIDLSIRGASFEVTARLMPGGRTQLELVGDGGRAVASGWIVRSEVSEIRPDTVRYRGACTFSAPLPWNPQLRAQDTSEGEPLTCRSDAYAPWSGWSETLLIFRHSQRLAGFTRGFHGSEATIDLWPSRTASFRNNDRLCGTMPAFDRRRSGFWVLPLGDRDPVRVFAVSSAVAEIRLF